MLNFLLLLWSLKVQIQLLFIADLRHKKMRLPTASNVASTSTSSSTSVIKPGRQIVTFLLVCNLGLWITYNFEMQKVSKTFPRTELFSQKNYMKTCTSWDKRFHEIFVMPKVRNAKRHWSILLFLLHFVQTH